MGSLVSLMQATQNITQQIANSRNILQSEIKLDQARGRDTSRKEGQLVDLSTHQFNADEYAADTISSVKEAIQQLTEESSVSNTENKKNELLTTESSNDNRNTKDSTTENSGDITIAAGDKSNGTIKNQRQASSGVDISV